MADAISAVIGIVMVAGIVWLTVASFIADARVAREVEDEIAAGDAQVTDIGGYLSRDRV